MIARNPFRLIERERPSCDGDNQMRVKESARRIRSINGYCYRRGACRPLSSRSGALLRVQRENETEAERETRKRFDEILHSSLIQMRSLAKDLIAVLASAIVAETSSRPPASK